MALQGMTFDDILGWIPTRFARYASGEASTARSVLVEAGLL